ncbi:MAG: phage tail protein [Chitinophagales bacterium]|nr:phage tail protein [Chitinophagales bacterium]
MANVSNAQKSFNWLIEVNGLNSFLAQKCNVPLPEIGAVSHGDTNYDVKTAGRIALEDMVLEKLVPAPGGDSWAMTWLQTARNMATGGGALPLNYKATVVVRELSDDGVTILRSFVYTGAWVRKVEHSGLDRTSEDNVIETVTISVDRVTQI